MLRGDFQTWADTWADRCYTKDTRRERRGKGDRPPPHLGAVGPRRRDQATLTSSSSDPHLDNNTIFICIYLISSFKKCVQRLGYLENHFFVMKKSSEGDLKMLKLL